jgi:hypothetical protein
VPRRERITLPDASALTRARQERFDEAGSDIRSVVPLHAVPSVVVTYDQLVAMPLDVRHAFVLSLIDGRMSVEMLLDVAALPEDETIAIMRRLLELGAIELRDTAPR